MLVSIERAAPAGSRPHPGAQDVRLLIRLLQRLAIFAIGIISAWLIAFVVFDFADKRLPWFLALAATYGVGAYVILPFAVRMGLKVQQRQHVPQYTITPDGLPGDPVNLALIGTLDELRGAFAAAGWQEADPLTMRSAWHMVRAFVLNRPYPTAPFSTLFLFGRGQDTGFQKAIGDSPRRRHHVRFWAQDLTRVQADIDEASFWLNTDKPDFSSRVLWVGAGTKDTGFGLTWLTFQITHATDSDTNAERDFVAKELVDASAIARFDLYRTGEELAAGKVNHYIADGEIAVAELVPMGIEA